MMTYDMWLYRYNSAQLERKDEQLRRRCSALEKRTLLVDRGVYIGSAVLVLLALGTAFYG